MPTAGCEELTRTSTTMRPSRTRTRCWTRATMNNLPVPTDASDFYRWMWLAYAAGRTDERGESPLEMEDGDAPILNLIRADYALRMERFIQVEPRPAWLQEY